VLFGVIWCFSVRLGSPLNTCFSFDIPLIINGLSEVLPAGIEPATNGLAIQGSAIQNLRSRLFIAYFWTMRRLAR
jgi:hypothetical protein